MVQLFDGIVAGILCGNKELYNPTFFYGSPDAVESVCQILLSDYKALHPKHKAIGINGDQFNRDFILSVIENRVESFINNLRTCDLLVFSQIEKRAGRMSAMLEFYEIFDHVFMSGGQIVIGSSVPPVMLDGMDDRILTQLESGMIYRVEE